MKTSVSHLMAVLLAASLLGGCQMLRRDPAPVPVQTEWSRALTQARREALAMRFGIADRVLAEFALRYPNAPEAYEAALERALFKIDPANQTGTPREASDLLDFYLAGPQALPQRAEAATLRRVATVLDRSSASAIAAAAPLAPSAAPAPSAPSTAGERARDEEVQRLRDGQKSLKEELAKANAELERIKRRLAQPSTTPP